MGKTMEGKIFFVGKMIEEKKFVSETTKEKIIFWPDTSTRKTKILLDTENEDLEKKSRRVLLRKKIILGVKENNLW